MKDKTLMKISLIISVVGLVALFVFVQFTEPSKVSISQISDSMLGQNVEVSGLIESFTTKNNNVFFTLDDGTGNISIVMFESIARKNPEVYALKDQIRVSVTGKISLYKSELELIASSLKLI